MLDSDSSSIETEFMGSSAAVGGKLGGKAVGIGLNKGDFSPLVDDDLDLSDPEMETEIAESACAAHVKRYLYVYETQNSPKDIDPTEHSATFVVPLPSDCLDLGTALAVLADKNEQVKGIVFYFSS